MLKSIWQSNRSVSNILTILATLLQCTTCGSGIQPSNWSSVLATSLGIREYSSSCPTSSFQVYRQADLQKPNAAHCNTSSIKQYQLTTTSRTHWITTDTNMDSNLIFTLLMRVWWSIRWTFKKSGPVASMLSWTSLTRQFLISGSITLKICLSKWVTSASAGPWVQRR